jgi:transcriptional regulator with XRE-family HTH domain
MEYSIRNYLPRQAKSKGQSKPDLKAIGLRIRSLRGDVVQQEFASRLGISQAQLSKVESGKVCPTLQTLVALAELFGKSLDWIVIGERER